MRYFFHISYKGTAYHGWQRQKNAVTVQEVLEDHLSTVFGQPISITGSGRTDTGVHAYQQYFHADIPDITDVGNLINKLNGFLPQDISVNDILPVIDRAHARYDAVLRSYEYRIIREKDPFNYEFAYRFSNRLSMDKMNRASKILIGKQDFQCFSRVKTDVNNFICEIFKVEWTEDGDILRFNISANRFLRGMVRAIVGTMLDVGQKKTTIPELKSIIKSKDRKAAGMTVPAKGLYLTEVRYPESIFL